MKARGGSAIGQVRRKLVAVLALLGGALAVMAIVGLPIASADTCVVTVKLLTGQVYTFTVDNVPPGTPVSQIPLPVTLTGIASETDSCTAPAPTTTTTSSLPSVSATSTTTSSSPTSTSSSTTTSPSTSSSGSGSSSRQLHVDHQVLHHPEPDVDQPRREAVVASAVVADDDHQEEEDRDQEGDQADQEQPAVGQGRPHRVQPDVLAVAARRRRRSGCPNFFIDSFQIPPFLLPIYQAAGIEYQVPWQVLAAINEIETDYGRNLSVSSAGAVGWMQFLPSTWKEWGVDANGDGVADPYNPVDAIFTAARYLHAAGASTNLTKAIFAYNHAGWYVQSVLLRAKLIGGIPSQLIGALTGLVEGHFPVAAPAKYADDEVVSLAKHRVTGSNAAIAIESNPATRGTSIFAKRGSPVIAVNDGKIVKVGNSAPARPLHRAPGRHRQHLHLRRTWAR